MFRLCVTEKLMHEQKRQSTLGIANTFFLTIDELLFSICQYIVVGLVNIPHTHDAHSQGAGCHRGTTGPDREHKGVGTGRVALCLSEIS